MKKLLFCMILFFGLSTSQYAYGAMKTYDAVSDDGLYKTQFMTYNTVTLESDFIPDRRLGDYFISASQVYSGEMAYFPKASFTWVNPNYIIVSGKQTVALSAEYNGEYIILHADIDVGLIPLKGGLLTDYVFDGYIGDPWDKTFSEIAFRDGKGFIPGTLNIENWDSTTAGTREFNWTFTPSDTKYESAAGTVKVKFEERKPDPGVDEPTVPSLTATTVTLNNLTAYDINLNDKIPGCKYKWTSSNPEVAEVNPKNGLVTAVSEGTATITCEITYPDETKQTLVSEVTVGYDDNAPELTDTVLDLNPGDEYDINVENKIAKSRYRWASSDRSIVTVNSANGIVTAKATGTAYVTCTITTPENQVIVLRCDINVTEQKEIK